MIHLLQSTSEHEHTHNDTFKISHIACCEKSSEEEAQKNFDSADPTVTKWNVEANENRHFACYQYPRSKTKKHYNDRINLAFLRCCRQMYHEAKYIPYSTNTFGIHCHHILGRFVDFLVRSPTKLHLALRSLYLDMAVVHPGNAKDWATAINVKIVKRLKLLQCIHIGFEQMPCLCKADQLVFTSSSSNRLLSSIKELQKMKLRSATVVITDSHFGERAWGWSEYPMLEEMYRWKLEDKQTWAKEAREHILRRSIGRETGKETAEVSTD